MKTIIVQTKKRLKGMSSNSEEKTAIVRMISSLRKKGAPRPHPKAEADLR